MQISKFCDLGYLTFAYPAALIKNGGILFRNTFARLEDITILVFKKMKYLHIRRAVPDKLGYLISQYCIYENIFSLIPSTYMNIG